jgi:hypothetical protein
MTLIVRPGFQFDTDASTYIEAVEVADAQALETATRYAINDFVIGCKQDGIWSAIKASCILAGARTLTGALIPLVGTAPTNVNFVSGDYNRKTGLVGNGSTKYLNSNRANNADPQDNMHISVFRSVAASNDGGLIYAGNGSGVESYLYTGFSNFFVSLNGSAGIAVASLASNTGSLFFGGSRTGSTAANIRVGSATGTSSNSSGTPTSLNYLVLRDSIRYSNARLAFYSIGESLNLAALDNRVSILIAQFGAVIP